MGRILFVDDDPNVLRGLRRMLRSMRDEWEMAFVEGGQQALAALEERPYDVIVSDMRMPGMDGAALLERVRVAYPGTVRIALSGHSDHDLLLRAAGVTHQYLSKPCAPEDLRDAIMRAFLLADLLGNRELQRLVTQMDVLPSLPSLYQEIAAELRRGDPALDRVGEIIAHDIGMTAKILQLVNSAFFGLREHVSTPTRAVQLLGLDTVTALVLGVGVFREFDATAVQIINLEQLWQHSATTGSCARTIARAEGFTAESTDYAFLAGLLHECGVLAIAANQPDEYALVYEEVARGERGLDSVEREVFGATHAELGAYLLGIWGLPDEVIQAVAFHLVLADCPSSGMHPAVAVHVGHAFALADSVAATAALDVDALRQRGLADRVPHWQSACLSDMKVSA